MCQTFYCGVILSPCNWTCKTTKKLFLPCEFDFCLHLYKFYNHASLHLLFIVTKMYTIWLGCSCFLKYCMPLLAAITSRFWEKYQCFQYCGFDPSFACTILQFSNSGAPYWFQSFEQWWLGICNIHLLHCTLNIHLYQKFIVWHLSPSHASAASESNEPGKQKPKSVLAVWWWLIVFWFLQVWWCNMSYFWPSCVCRRNIKMQCHWVTGRTF
jgi:hypothetical protein